METYKIIDSVFEGISFVKPQRKIHMGYTGENLAPMFRKKFIRPEGRRATLYISAPGFMHCYINGKEITEDKFISPVSDYRKTLWYNIYDVTTFLTEGENVIALWCGNGWYNEEFKSSWNYDEAEWRDVPKFILRLDMDGRSFLVSDDTWKCLPETAITFNALRSGEYFDARLYDDTWNTIAFDDGNWEPAIIDDTPPTGKFKLCYCEPIREFEEYKTKELIKVSGTKYVFDIGQNISGYVHLRVKEGFHDSLTIRYAEQITENNELQLNKMNEHYPASPFQTDKFTGNGYPMVWSPKFCYHGFRYIEIEGITDIKQIEVSGIFVHQAVDRRGHFKCSDEYLNKMFNAGVMSVYSNMFYSITDCPTREKLGWANDAQSSMENLLTNFKSEIVLVKWLHDIQDAMRDDGALPGIIPTPGWGFHWGNGPVSDGVLFELPYRVYLHTGSKSPLISSLPYFERYIDYIDTRKDEDGFIRFGLDDWARPERKPGDVPVEFINAVLLYNFCNIARLAAELADTDTAKFEAKAEAYKAQIMGTYLAEDGSCKIDRQTALAMLIYFGLYTDLEPLKAQLKACIEETDLHHDCGMVGLRRLYIALNKCGLQEYGYKILRSEGFPSYKEWFNRDATTLWEHWDYRKCMDSKNHHMYSDFMSWLIKTAVGINRTAPGFASVNIDPYFFESMNEAVGMVDTVRGSISVSWKKRRKEITVTVHVPNGIKATYKGEPITEAVQTFTHER